MPSVSRLARKGNAEQRQVRKAAAKVRKKMGNEKLKMKNLMPQAIFFAKQAIFSLFIRNFASDFGHRRPCQHEKNDDTRGIRTAEGIRTAGRRTDGPAVDWRAGVLRAGTDQRADGIGGSGDDSGNALPGG
jgi:hypothetical protein